MAENAVSAIIQGILTPVVEKSIVLAAGKFESFLHFEKDLAQLQKFLQMLQAFLCDVQPQQLNNAAVKIWLERLESVAYEADNVLDEFNYEILRREVTIHGSKRRKAIDFMTTYNPVAFCVKMTARVQEIIREVNIINRDAGVLGLKSQTAVTNVTLTRETHSLNMDSNVVGRDKDTSEILNILMSPSDEIITVIPITGMTGIGKTTLARKVFNHEQVQVKFNKRIWVSAAESFDVTRLFDKMLESLTEKKPKAESTDVKLRKLQKELIGKRYLLVVDGVWNDNSALWSEFHESLRGMSTAKGNCILVTSRGQGVEFMKATYPSISLSKLSVDDCWLILKENAFDGGEVAEELQSLGREIAQRCHGLPLLAKILGGILYKKGREEWDSVLHNNFQDSTEEENYVMQIFKVSFDRLPSPAAKKCFAYCSIFPKDYDIEREKLIQLWMAEGFLETKPESEMEMEEMGDNIFNILLQSSLLKDVTKDGSGNILHCKMHDAVHDLAQTISRSKEIRYLSVGGTAEGTQKLLEKARNVRTLFFEDNFSDNMASTFTSLRVLSLSSSGVTELCNSIGKLSHLRCLDLSKTRIKALPKSICKLYYLQTLRAKECYSLTEFPDKFKNLINLRHFDLSTYNSSRILMPTKLGRLTSLRTLPFFNIGDEKGRRIEELKGLKNLCGSLELRNLELVNIGRDGDDPASLSEKKNLRDLIFSWANKWEGNKMDNAVLEGLQPHPNLKTLVIQNFMGDQLASWIAKLGNLVNLQLNYCRKCEEVPELGQLCFLRSLEFNGLHGVRHFCHSFYGSTSQCGCGQVAKRVFPKLERLILRDMSNLMKWMEIEGETKAGGLIVFPVLKELTIENCPHLSYAPSHFPSLEKLVINSVNHGSQVIAKICSKVTTLRSLSINKVRELDYLPDCLLSNNPGLANLKLSSCPSLLSIPTVGGPHSLRSLEILDCHGLIRLPGEMVDCFPSLEHLWVRSCSNLVSFPVNFHRARSLGRLDLSDCPKLSSMPERLGSLNRLLDLAIGPFLGTVELDSFLKIFDGIQDMSSSLEYFYLYGWPHWKDLPDQLQHLSALKRFCLYNIGVEALPDWFGNLSSLEELWLVDCVKLQSLPSSEAMSLLTKLRELHIDNCPFLKERCKDRSSFDSELSKICHIPNIYIDGEKIES